MNDQINYCFAHFILVHHFQILDASLERISDDPLFTWHGFFWLFVIGIMMLLLFIVGWEANLYFQLGRGQVFSSRSFSFFSRILLV